MNDTPRFGIDTASLITHIKNGVTSSQDVIEICSKLHTSQEGLPSFPAHLSLRQSSFGKNEPPVSPPSYFKSFSGFLSNSYSQLQFTFIRNILVVMICLYLLNFVFIFTIKDEKEDDFLGVLDCLEVMLLLIVPVFLDAWLDNRKQTRIIETIERLGERGTTTMTLRNGQLQALKLREIVVGDVIRLNVDDVVPADGLLFENSEIVLDPKKCVTNNVGHCCTAGSIVSKGEGLMVVTCVGPNTQIHLLINEPPQKKETIWAPLILRTATILGLITSISMVLRFSITNYIIESNQWHFKDLQRYVSFMGRGFSNFVAVIPLTLPLVIVWTFYRTRDKSKARLGISKFIQFRLTMNIVIVLSDIVNIHYSNGEISVLKNVQKAWLHLISNLLGIAIFPSDTKEGSITDGDVLPSQTIKYIIGQVIFQLGIVLTLTFNSDELFGIDPSTYSTMIFPTLVFMTLFHALCVRGSRTRRNVFSGIFQHPMFCTFWIIIFILQVAVTQFGGQAFSTFSLSLFEMVCSMFLALGVLLWMQVLVCICCCEPEDEQCTRSVDYVPETSV